MTDDPMQMTRRRYLFIKAIEQIPEPGLVNYAIAREAVSSVAIEHPEWDMDETKTWAEWEADL